MNQYFPTIAFVISFLTFVGGIIYFLGNFKKGRSDSADNVINLLQDEVAAQKQRLDTTTMQISQLTSTSALQGTQIIQLQADNQFLKNLIQEALVMYFKETNSSIPELQEKLSK